MDKRWILIIIIAIIGIGCLYLIVESSNVVGSANSNIDKFIITIPDSFNIEKSTSDELRLINRANGERINIVYLGKGSDMNQNISDKMEALYENENITIMKNTKIKINNETLPSIYFEKLPNNSINQIAFLTKFNHKFSIECSNFKDNATIKEKIEQINETLKKDFKQKQD